MKVRQKYVMRFLPWHWCDDWVLLLDLVPLAWVWFGLGGLFVPLFDVGNMNLRFGEAVILSKSAKCGHSMTLHNLGEQD